MHKILRTLSQKYNITLENINEDNRCYVAGSTIFIGKYKDSELLLISFFHEIGHRLIKNQFIKKWEYNTLLIEIECWRLGIDEARKNGILFTDNAINWGYKTALSYTGHDARECLNWKNKYGKKLFINKIKGSIGLGDRLARYSTT